MSAKTAGLVVSLTIALSGALQASDRIVPPAVPTDIEVPVGSKPFFAGHAVGTQNFISAPAPTPTGGDELAKAAFIQRVNTKGGMKPPSNECTPGTLNNRKLVYYEADSFFYQ